MDKYIVIKNGLVLTLDRKGHSGYFNIILRNGKIFLIDYERKFNEKEFKQKNPESEIIDARDKLIMPGLFNSKLISSYSLNKIFFRKCTYQNLSSWQSLKLIDRYLSEIENTVTLRDLLKISYLRSIRNGEVFVNESSINIGKDFFDVYLTDFDWIKQYYNFTSYDYKINPGSEGKISYGFISDENINNYSLSSIRKDLSGKKIKLFIDASLSEKSFDSIKKVFGKSFVNVLEDMDLVTSDTIISNPTHLNPLELEILYQKKSTILISPSDYLNLSYKRIDMEELLMSGIRIIIGTGFTGNDILSELKVFSTMISKNILSYENMLKLAIYNPSTVFGISNLTGVIDRNRSADLIFFDLNDIRNSLTLPETDRENVSEFILNNLNTKDISDVMIKGEFIIKDKEEQINFIESPQLKAKEISKKLYSAGKYFEYKEKYLIRSRVDSLGTDRSDEEEVLKKEEIFVDMTETGEYTGEGEFTILGTKEEEFEKPRERDIPKAENKINLKEIKSLEKELNLFEGLEDLSESTKPKKIRKKVVKEADIKAVSKDEMIEIRDKDERTKSEEEIYESDGIKITEETKSKKDIELESEMSKPLTIKPAKLKFGFGDGDS